MADIINGRYALADPYSGLTVFSLEGGELNMFGSCTRIRTSQREAYPAIDDAPTELKVESKSNFLSTLAYGIIGAAVSACLAAVAISIVASATVLTGGAALAACAFLGASLTTFAFTAGMVENDLRTGNNKSPVEFMAELMENAIIGYGAGATVYGVIAAAPVLAVGGSTEAVMYLGNSNLTEKVIPNTIKLGGSAIAAAEAAFSVNDAYARGSGYNLLLEAAYDGDIEAYEATEFCMDVLALGYVQAAEAYAMVYTVKEGVYIEERNDLPDYVDDQLDDVPAETWNLGNALRGKTVDNSRKLKNNLGDNFPVCDTIKNRVLGSTKSYNTTCKTYSNARNWYNVLKRDADKLDKFTEKMWHTYRLRVYFYDRKQLNIVIPNCELTAAQQEVLKQIKEYAKTLNNKGRIGIKVYITR